MKIVKNVNFCNYVFVAKLSLFIVQRQYVIHFVQKCQVLRFARNYYAYAVNITVLRAAVKNYGFLILKFFFLIFLNFKLENSNIARTKIVTIFENKFLTMLPNN